MKYPLWLPEARVHQDLDDKTLVHMLYGAGIVDRQPELIDSPVSALEEVTIRYSMWKSTVDDNMASALGDRLAAVKLGMFAEVAARRDFEAARDFEEHVLSLGYGGSE